MQSKLLWMDGNSAVPEFGAAEGAVCSLEVVYESSLGEGLRRLNTGEYCAAVMNASSFGGLGESALEEVLHQDPRFPVIVHCPEGTVDDAIRLTRRGAFYVLVGKIERPRLDQAIRMALERCHPKAHADLGTCPWRTLIVGRSGAIEHICEVIRLVASKRVTVLITGETGTGKEVIAKAIHAASKRSVRPMVSVNCTALPANLIEAELFGHTKGAFTGAHGSRIGRFEQASRSTIFLDEIGDLPLEAQAKLLRVLQEHEFERIGSSETVSVDVRVLAASNVDLEQAVKERRFREDLYYRLNVVPLRLPPLRERREDIPLLVEHFLHKVQTTEESSAKRISPEAIEFLSALDWPGNVRQLEHAVQKAVALSGERGLLVPTDFSNSCRRRPPQRAVKQTSALPAISIPSDGIDFDEVVSSFELSLLNQALQASGGNKARAADLLRMKRTTLLAKMKVHEQRSGACATAIPSAPSVRPTALVFEHDAAVRKMIAKTLEQEGYRVLEAPSEPMAVELFQCWSSHINLLIIDNVSDENASRLRDLGHNVPRLLLCQALNSPDFDERDSPLARPGEQRLQRPFSSHELLSAVKTVSSESAPSFAVCA